MWKPIIRDTSDLRVQIFRARTDATLPAADTRIPTNSTLKHSSSAIRRSSKLQSDSKMPIQTPSSRAETSQPDLQSRSSAVDLNPPSTHDNDDHAWVDEDDDDAYAPSERPSAVECDSQRCLRSHRKLAGSAVPSGSRTVVEYEYSAGPALGTRNEPSTSNGGRSTG